MCPVGIFMAILQEVYSFLTRFLHYNAHTCINKLQKNLIDVNLKAVAGKNFFCLVVFEVKIRSDSLSPTKL